MELLLKGNIKKIGATFGIIESHSYDEDHFFIKSDIIKQDRRKVKLGDTVSFELKTNNSRGSNAIKIHLCTNEEIKTDLKKDKSFKTFGVISIIEEIFNNQKPYVSVEQFQKFITDGFHILESDNKGLNELIKLVVHDNVITDTEKVFLQEKTQELNLSIDLLEQANNYMFSNNPYFDNILGIIFKDGIIKENEIAFLLEKSKENSFTSSFINNRFWQYSFSLHLDILLKNENIVKIIKLWYLSQNTKFGLTIDKDWIILQLNILKSTKIEQNIERTIEHFENTIFPFLSNKFNISFNSLKEIYNHISLDSKERVEYQVQDHIRTLLSNKLYKKEDIYKVFSVPVDQQKGKWHNGYCEHNGEWFIFTNIGQSGHGFNESDEFNYNNSLDPFGDLNWEAINNSRLTWDSINSLKASSPFIFVRTPQTQKHYWEYLGKGNCIYTLDTSPVAFKWKIQRQDLNNKKSKTEKTTFEVKKIKSYWNRNIVPLKHKDTIINLLNEDEIFEASQLYLKLAYDNGQIKTDKIMDEFEKIIENLGK